MGDGFELARLFDPSRGYGRHPGEERGEAPAVSVAHDEPVVVRDDLDRLEDALGGDAPGQPFQLRQDLGVVGIVGGAAFEKL